MRGLVRCDTVEKPTVGVVHLHRRWWRPRRVSEVLYQPVGRSVVYLVPEDRLPELWAAETFEQAMALVRGVVPRDH